MLEQELQLHRFILHYARLQLAGIDDSRLADQPAPGVNHPAWIVGHLAMAADYGVVMLGGAKEIPDSWYQKFGPGSKPIPERAAYPSKEELLKALGHAHERLGVAASSATPEQLARPQTRLFPDHFPTVGAMLCHLMTTHPAVHLGQLSTWRRVNGLGSVLGV